jgi:hypothetical protein
MKPLTKIRRACSKSNQWSWDLDEFQRSYPKLSMSDREWRGLCSESESEIWVTIVGDLRLLQVTGEES